MCRKYGRKGLVSSYLNPVKKTITKLTIRKDLLLYHFNDDADLQARFSAFQYGFRAGVATETALHKFVRRIELSLAKKRTALGIFLDIVGAFGNITHSGIADALRELKVSPFLVRWIENLLRHCTVQVELNGEKIKREVARGSPQSGILNPFLWNCIKLLVGRPTQQGFLCTSLCQ